jgi:SAM-dependent methyltransferase
LDVIRELTPKGLRHSILDVGCGDSLFFDALAPYGDVEGVEPDRNLLSPGADGRVHVAPFDHRFEPGRRYSLILLLDVLEHLREPAAALRRARELLEPQGRILMTVPAFRWLWTEHDVMNEHLTRYDRSSLEALVAGADLELRSSRYFFYWTVPIKLAVAGVERIRHLRARPPAVPPAGINRLLYLLSRGEERLLGRLRIPVGTSLLAIASHDTRTAAGQEQAASLPAAGRHGQTPRGVAR